MSKFIELYRTPYINTASKLASTTGLIALFGFMSISALIVGPDKVHSKLKIFGGMFGCIGGIVAVYCAGYAVGMTYSQIRLRMK